MRACGLGPSPPSVLPMQVMADILPRDTLDHRLDLLKVGSEYANKKLKEVKAPVLLLAR
jgi:hypothetical protein